MVLECLIFFEVTPLYFLMYVRHADKVAFKWVGTGVFNARSVWGFFWFWQQQPQSSCGQRMPASLTLWMSCTRDPLAICVLMDCHGQTLVLSVVDDSLKVNSCREEQAPPRHPMAESGLNPGRAVFPRLV